VVATFTDPGGAEALSDYSAAIDWGDSLTSAGAITFAGGVFTVTGDHAYALQGTYPVTVTVQHDGTPTATATSSAAVGDLALAPAVFTAVEGADPGGQALANFTDPAGTEDPSTYGADINWGDGSASGGTITFAGGVFTVAGDHAYADDGFYGVTVTVHHDGADATVVTTAVVSDPAVVASGGFAVTAAEGTDSGGQVVATFADPAGAEALSDYSATVDWGDGLTSGGAISFAGGVFTVTGDHTYAEDGGFVVTVTVHHDGAPDAVTTSTAAISDPAVAASGGFTFMAGPGVDPGGQVVATFTDPGGAEALSDYSAAIDWGDSLTSAGTITFANGAFTVTGDHTYAAGGAYGVTVTIHHDSAPDATAVSAADVSDPFVLLSGGFNLAVTQAEDAGGQVVATFTDPGGAEPLSAYSATIDWGDSSASGGMITFAGGVFSVTGDHAYVEEGSYVVSVTVQHDGADVTTTSTAVVSDLAVTLTGGYTVTAVEGADAGGQVVATFTDPGGAEALSHYSASIDWGDGSASGGAIAFSSGVFTVTGDHAYAEEGSHTVTVTVHHDTAPDAVTTSTAGVSDPAVAASGGFTVTAVEGTDPGGQVVATFTDPGGAEAVGTYGATVDWGDGFASAGTVTFASGVFTVTGDHTYADSGSFTVHVTIQDEGGSSVVVTSTATVSDVGPTAGLSGPTNGVPGQPRTYTLSATDPSPADQAAGFTYTIQWGDGSPVQTITASAGNGSGLALDHVFTAPGSYTVQLTATNNDGTASAAVTTSVTIMRAEMQGNTLAVGGTPGNDTILLTPSDTKGNIKVMLGTTLVGKFHPTDHIFIYGQAGNDTIKLKGTAFKGILYTITVPAFLFAGDGTDTLNVAGSSANNVLIGGAGSDKLIGGLGRDLLIGGGGVDQLTAGSGDDILIGGSTSYDLEAAGMTGDAKLAALTAIMAEWGRTDADYLTRVNHLNGSLGGGLNGSSFLNATTVHGDGAADTLIGSTSASALDWFFVDAQDSTKNKRTGEVVTTVT
jgi:PKD repeat protein